MICQLRSRR